MNSFAVTSTTTTLGQNPVSAQLGAEVELDYANGLTGALKSLGWSEGLEASAPIRGMHAYGYTIDEQRAVDLYVAEARNLGMTPLTDLAGNVYLIREGDPATRGSLKAVTVTSHLDTVEGGGAHDGRDGLVAALAAVKALNESNTTLPHDLVIMVCRSEESDINGVFSLGARLACGDVTWDELSRCKNRKSGRLVTEEMSAIGLDVAALKERLSKATQEERALIPIGEQARSLVGSLVELHIEQGRYVSGDPSEPDVGLVQAIRGNARGRGCTITLNDCDSSDQSTATIRALRISRGRRSYTISIPIQGEAAHSGATKPEDRADAVCTALYIGAETLSQFRDAGGTQKSSLTIVELTTSNTSPTTIADNANIVFRVDGATTSEIRRIARSIKNLCRDLSRHTQNKQLKIGEGGTVRSIRPVLNPEQGRSQIHQVVESYVAIMNKARDWFSECYKIDGKDIVFTPAVVNWDNSADGGPTLGFHFEIRSIDPTVLTNFRNFVAGLVQTHNESPRSATTINVPDLLISQPVESDAAVLQALSEIAKETGVHFNLVNSGAGHDTSTLTRCGYPGAIIFIKQPNPISHNPDEAHDDESFSKAIKLLTDFLNKRSVSGNSGSFVAELKSRGAREI